MATVTQQHPPIARPPTGFEVAVDAAFKWCARSFAWLTILVVVLIVGLIAWQASPAIQAYGVKFIVDSVWDPGKGQYGILPEIVGTLFSSVLGVAIGSLFGVAVAIFLTQEFIPRWLETTFKNIINLL